MNQLRFRGPVIRFIASTNPFGSVTLSLTVSVSIMNPPMRMI
jgi:hypothetical protein